MSNGTDEDEIKQAHDDGYQFGVSLTEEMLDEFDGNKEVAKSQVETDYYCDYQSEPAKQAHQRGFMKAANDVLKKTKKVDRPMSARQRASYFPAGSEERGFLNDSDD